MMDGISLTAATTAVTAGMGIMLAQVTSPEMAVAAGIEKYGPMAVCMALLVWLLRSVHLSSEERIKAIHAARVEEAKEFATDMAKSLDTERAWSRQVYQDLMNLLKEGSARG